MKRFAARDVAQALLITFGLAGVLASLSGCSTDNASMNRTQGAVPDLRCDYGAPCGKTPGASAEGTISR